MFSNIQLTKIIQFFLIYIKTKIKRKKNEKLMDMLGVNHRIFE